MKRTRISPAAAEHGLLTAQVLRTGRSMSTLIREDLAVIDPPDVEATTGTCAPQSVSVG